MEPSFVNAPTVLPRPGAGGDTSWLVGRRIGPGGIFELQSRAAIGGMGEIWAAWMHDPRGPRRVAIKIIRPGISSELSRELFTREMEMHDRVRDVKGVIPLLERGTFEGPTAGEPIYYFAMEWISAARPLTQACEGLTLDRKVALFTRVCETMDVVHKRAIVHCDIKPANILVDEAGTPWLTDFGLAISTRTHERKHTGWDIGSLRGTWSYMAPEQCDERCDPYSFTPALDVYSLGVSFYECITGHLPYSQDPASLGDKTQAAAIIREGPRVPRRVGGRTLPPTLRSALTTALSRRPEDRHADAGQLGAQLRPLVQKGKSREWVLAVVLMVVCLAVGELLTAPLLNSEAVYSRWYAAAASLAGNRVKLDNVAIVANIGREAEMGPLKVREHTSLIQAAGLGVPITPDSNPREFFAATIDRLRELDVKVVVLDYYFPEPATDSATRRLVKAIQDFEGPAASPRGWIGIGVEDWRPEPGKNSIDPAMADVADRAFSLKTRLSTAPRDVFSEIAFISSNDSVQGAAAFMAASAFRAPWAKLSLSVDAPTVGKKGSVKVTYGSRAGAAAVREESEAELKAVAVSVVVETVDDRRAVDIDHYGQYATLNGADRLCSVSLLDIPSATEFNQATIKSTDLWELETRDLKKRLEGKVVVIGDQYTDTSRPVDQHARPGQTRDIWGVELQATFVQACIDTIKLKVGFTSDVSESVANFGMPLATLTGIGFGWWLVRRLPVVSGRLVLVAAAGVVLISCGVALMSLVGPMWIWNPFLMPASFGLAAGASVLSPWLRV
jgi:serine/threonine protein kinase